MNFIIYVKRILKAAMRKLRIFKVNIILIVVIQNYILENTEGIPEFLRIVLTLSDVFYINSQKSFLHFM
jgi:hypothetical protein